MKDRALDDLYAIFVRRPEGIQPGLVRIARAWKELGEFRIPCFLIGGTNGKGSTSGMLWHMLSILGNRVGLFTSPHILEFRERIQISGINLTDKDLAQALKRLRASLSVECEKELSFFELATLLARRVFEEQRCDLAVFEVGLGGRWDATNILDPMQSAVVSVDLDHEKWLGSTLEEIFTEKVQIARRDRPFFWGETDSRKKQILLPILQTAKNSTGFTLIEQGKDFYLDKDLVFLQFTGQWISFALPDYLQRFSLPLKQNFALAFAMLVRYLNIKEDEVLHIAGRLQREFGKEALPFSFFGRTQYFKIKREGYIQELLCDVCHNPASVKEFVAYLRLHYGSECKLPGLITFLEDKDYRSMLTELKQVLSPLIFFTNSGHRALQTLADPEVSVAENALQGLEILPESRDVPWVVCGSFWAVSDVLRALQLRYDFF